MKKAVMEIEEIDHLLCCAHTLQLVIGKGLLLVKQLMKDLVKILQPFANAMKMLGGSKYTTMSYMFPAISSFKKLLNIIYDAQININLDNSNTVFNDDQEFQE
ncbi:24866_t:CDS:2 [Cetraspora pellucida]|uniref:24866_t:CDS:1 n=1 Tax=Cetraspora pellucida TaxID=1433469 RepID=A0A9N9NG02_9GLOM|nr:24866_t:CDS:2 [Cetraspora pellucida]